MARTTGDITADYDDDTRVGFDEDMARVKELMGSAPRKNTADEMAAKRARELNRQDPNIPKYKALLDTLLPQIEANSPNEAAYTKNLLRQFREFEQAGHDVGDVDSQIAELVLTYRKKHTRTDMHAGEDDQPFEPNPMQQNRRMELEQYQQEFMDRQK